jgi:hypothetical protein
MVVTKTGFKRAFTDVKIFSRDALPEILRLAGLIAISKPESMQRSFDIWLVDLCFLCFAKN